MPAHIRIFLTVLGTMACAAAGAAQTQVTFKQVTTNNPIAMPAGERSENIYTADLNNDGLTDIVQDAGDAAGHFSVSIAKPGGTFKPAVNYSYPPEGAIVQRAALALGDFNSDGKIDLVAAMIGTTELAFYAGNGDGTFQAPKIYPVNLYLTSGGLIGGSRMVAIGLNLYLTGQSGNPAQLYVIRGTGDGTFFPPIELDSENYPIKQLVEGDFDGDGVGDIAFSTTDVYGRTRVDVLFLDEAGTVNPEGQPEPVPIQLDYQTGSLILGGGDLNGDGRTDLIAIYPNASGSSTWASILYGRADLTFDAAQFSLGPAPYGTGSDLGAQVVVGDFNDDGNMDFAVPSGMSGAYSLKFFLSQGARGPFRAQTLNLGPDASQSNPAVGLFNFDDKPDVAVAEYNSGNNSVIATELNGTAQGVWSNCPYPLTGRGISLCAPTSSYDGPIVSPVDFSAAAHSFGQLRAMELWVDGTRWSTQHNAWENSAFLHFTAKVGPGAHQGKIVATDIEGSTQQLDFDFIVGGSGCAPPTASGAKICSLSSTEGGAVVTASATVSGALARLEVWADGAKEYTAMSSNSLSALIGLSPGTHRITVVAVNAKGAQWMQSSGVVVP